MLDPKGLRPNWSIGAVGHWSNGLESSGVRPKAQGTKGKTFCLMPDTTNIHYSSTPTLHHSVWMADLLFQ